VPDRTPDANPLAHARALRELGEEAVKETT
jgi:hypothetical protein